MGSFGHVCVFVCVNEHQAAAAISEFRCLAMHAPT